MRNNNVNDNFLQFQIYQTLLQGQKTPKNYQFQILQSTEMILIFIFKADYIYPKLFIPGNRVTKEDQRYNFFKLNIQINFLPPVFKIPVESVRYFKKTEDVKCPYVFTTERREGEKKKSWNVPNLVT